MNSSVPIIPVANLALMLIPVLLTLTIFYRWSVLYQTTIHAFARMLIQLVLIGYVLNYLFTDDRLILVAGILTVMLLVAAWIALRPLPCKNRRDYIRVLTAITVGTAISLAMVTQQVLNIEPWFSVKHTIPLAGIIIANAMNAVSLAAERFASETATGKSYLLARHTALQAAMIPVINMLFAVGVVSLPGFMTGQILSGVEPLIAVRYQIMVMTMVFLASSLAVIIYLTMNKPHDSPPDTDRNSIATTVKDNAPDQSSGRP